MLHATQHIQTVLGCCIPSYRLFSEHKRMVHLPDKLICHLFAITTGLTRSHVLQFFRCQALQADNDILKHSLSKAALAGLPPRPQSALHFTTRSRPLSRSSSYANQVEQHAALLLHNSMQHFYHSTVSLVSVSTTDSTKIYHITIRSHSSHAQAANHCVACVALTVPVPDTVTLSFCCKRSNQIVR